MSAPTKLAAAPPSLPEHVHDSEVLSAAAACARARAEAVLVWAKLDEVDLFDAREVITPDNPAGRYMEESRQGLDTLAANEPQTIRGAAAMLNIALDLLVQRMPDPETALGEGPLFEIVRNVRSALANVNPDFALCLGANEPEAGT